MPQLTVDGRAVHYGDGGVPWRGGAPLLVLLHGAGGDHTVWALQARALAQHGWNVAAPDLPGHGRSADGESLPRASGASRGGLDTVEAHAAWLGRFLDALRAERVALVGHSMGACIALTVAAEAPERVLALGLVGAGDAMRVNPELLDDTLNAKPRAERFIAAFGHGRGAHFGLARSPGVWMIGTTLALLHRCPAPVLHRDFAACNAWDGAPLAPQVAAPTLVVSGASDRMTPPAVGRALAEAIPGARYVLVPDTGHMLMAESPDAVTRALRTFLEPLARGERAAG